MKKRVVILGAGGHAAVVVETILLTGEFEIVGLLDPDPGKQQTRVLGIPVLGGDEELLRLKAIGLEGALVGVGYAQSPHRRLALYNFLTSSGVQLVTVIHPSAIVSPSARVGPGTVVLAGAIINAHARVGANAIINTGAIVEHDCEVGDHAHIATGARLAGSVRVGAGALVGAGATVLNGVHIGEYARVGLGAAVIHDVPAGVTVAGVPARPIKVQK